MRKYGFLMLTALTSVIFLTACAGGTNNAPTPTVTGEQMESVYQTIAPADAKDLIGTEGVVLVDVRTQEEYNEGYIPGAVLLPVDDIQQKAETSLPDKDATIIIYCRSGRRSALAADELFNMGYKRVYDLGGILDWPYETAKG